MVPEKKITPEDVKYVLSSHYQGTLYDPYGSSQSDQKGAFRSIGINRNDFMALIQMRPDQPEDSRVLEWIAFASNAFNVMVPFYANVTTTPAYLSNTTGAVSTDNFYWNSRMIAAMADAAYSKSVFHIERYQLAALPPGMRTSILTMPSCAVNRMLPPAPLCASRPTKPWPIPSAAWPPTHWTKCCMS